MDFDSNGLKIFCTVLTKGSFSAAARELKISQPSVSQMIARLEEKLGSNLFERIGHEVIPTRVAQEFHRFALSVLEQVSAFETKLMSGQTNPRGLVRFAKPESCLWTPYYRMIMRELSKFAELQIEIEIATNDEIIDGILRDRYDFGFVVGERIQSEIRFEQFGYEEYVAVQQSSAKSDSLAAANLENLRIISYPGWERYFETWSTAQGMWQRLRKLDLQPVVRVGNLAGALHAVQEGAGIGIFPSQCVQEQLMKKTLKRMDPKPEVIAKTSVHLAKRRSFIFPARVETVVATLRQAKAKFG